MSDTPSFDDLADVLTGNYRVNRINAVRLDAMASSLTIMSIVVCFVVGIMLGHLFLKVRSMNG